MGSNTKTSNFYRDKPLFGLDIGYSSLKVMQIVRKKKQTVVTGYGVASFDHDFMKNGEIIDFEGLAKIARDLFEHHVVGKVTTRRVAVSIPVARTFNRAVTLPNMAEKDLADAVRLEAEQYIPVPLEELYVDYSIITKGEKETELLVVAVPKKIVDSYNNFLRIIGLEPAVFETTISAASRLVSYAEASDIPTVLVDLGSLSVDITIVDKTLIVTGTVPGGGDTFTNLVAEKLNLSRQEAHTIKTKYGLSASKKQTAITEALKPQLDSLLKEIKRMVRYYEERGASERKIGQVITMGGGANLPGLSEYMTNLLRLPVRMVDPWQNMTFAGLQPPNAIEKTMYVSVAGLALLRPTEIFDKDIL